MELKRKIKNLLKLLIPSQIYWLPRYYILFKQCKFRKDDVVLDAGCGEGFVSLKLVSCCKYVVGLDMSEDRIGAASERKTKSKFKYKVNFLIADITYAPFPDNTFDKIIFLDSLHEIKQDTLALSEIFRILKPFGQLFVSEVCGCVCSAELFKGQTILRRVIPDFLRSKYLSEGKSWLKADDNFIKKEWHILKYYMLGDLKMLTEHLFNIAGYGYILKRCGALATDITYGVKGLWGLRFLFFFLAVRIDYYLGKKLLGYGIFVELIKK